ncbi:MAG: AAA family ATPase [Planctomycetota bacterium]
MTDGSSLDASSAPVTTWSALIGHQRVVSAIRVAIRKGRLSGSLLLVGPPGVGKSTVARLIALTQLCQRSVPSEMNPCGGCESCKQVLAETHPDLVQVRKPDSKTFIPLESLIGPTEARMRRGFCHDMHLRPAAGERKVAILHDADFLNEEGANCLLKTLEEPPGNALILLVGTSEQRQLPTIRSRCQVLRLSTPVGDDAIALMRRQLASRDDDGESISNNLDDQTILDAIEMSAGDLHAAKRFLVSDANDFRSTMVTQLSDSQPDPTSMVRILNQHLDRAGKDSPKRRAAMKEASSIMVQHYRGLLRHQAMSGGYDSSTSRRLDRVVRSFREIDRMANLATLVECLAADLTLAETGDRGDIG